MDMTKAYTVKYCVDDQYTSRCIIQANNGIEAIKKFLTACENRSLREFEFLNSVEDLKFFHIEKWCFVKTEDDDDSLGIVGEV
jgi:predicted ATP-grasp superfamily ATP-dependent carboligase